MVSVGREVGAEHWHLKPKICKPSHCCPSGATFSERCLGKSLVFIYWNHIMFAQDLWKLVTNIIDPPQVNHKYSIFNFQSSIPALPGWAACGQSQLGLLGPSSGGNCRIWCKVIIPVWLNLYKSVHKIQVICGIEWLPPIFISHFNLLLHALTELVYGPGIPLQSPNGREYLLFSIDNLHSPAFP